MRHYRDAEALADDGRYDNAGHLIGFAAECALKHHFNVTTTESSPRMHLPELASTMRKRFSARNPRQAVMRRLLDGFGAAFFSDWDVAHRYEADGVVSTELYHSWRVVTRRVLGAAGLRATGAGAQQ
jgi:hypothetical protein